ncbi:hypothetical protein WMY93_026924 [Mugilogobius chulae]|uniref:Uncharacterized protein n=1 Tax=Mugilogobius chulae TaxID=88201 RepID=A0AAW0MT90_9GOBI
MVLCGGVGSEERLIVAEKRHHRSQITTNYLPLCNSRRGSRAAAGYSYLEGRQYAGLPKKHSVERELASGARRREEGEKARQRRREHWVSRQVIRIVAPETNLQRERTRWSAGPRH